jgi:hypothetical protein
MAAQEQEGNPGKRPWRAALGVLGRIAIGLHVVAITSWSLPEPPNAVLGGTAKPYGSDWILLWNEKHVKRGAIQRYLFLTGFWQYWDMFAPDPASIDFWGDAEVTFKDGTTKRYQYPRMYTLSVVEKYFKERYRKFYERAHSEDYAYFWRPFAQRIAYELDRGPSNPPVKVKLYRHWLALRGPNRPIPSEYASYMYYEHEVDQEALERARHTP